MTPLSELNASAVDPPCRHVEGSAAGTHGMCGCHGLQVQGQLLEKLQGEKLSQSGQDRSRRLAAPRADRVDRASAGMPSGTSTKSAQVGGSSIV